MKSEILYCIQTGDDYNTYDFNSTRKRDAIVMAHAEAKNTNIDLGDEIRIQKIRAIDGQYDSDIGSPIIIRKGYNGDHSEPKEAQREYWRKQPKRARA